MMPSDKNHDAVALVLVAATLALPVADGVYSIQKAAYLFVGIATVSVVLDRVIGHFMSEPEFCTEPSCTRGAQVFVTDGYGFCPKHAAEFYDEIEKQSA